VPERRRGGDRLNRGTGGGLSELRRGWGPPPAGAEARGGPPEEYSCDLAIWEEKGREEWNGMTSGTHTEEKEMTSNLS
jgi:hypothetical protein